MLVLLKVSESSFFDVNDRSVQSDPALRSVSSPRETHPIHLRAVEAAREHQRAESALVEALMAVDRERVFSELGYSSLFKYAVESLGLSEATAYNFITVARRSREVPELQVAVAQGALSVSKAKKIAAVLTQENQVEWLEKAKTLSSRQLEKEVARENPRLATQERAVYVSGKRLELTLGVEEALMLKLRRAQDQVSRSKNRAVTLEETLLELADFYLQRKDPVEKAKRVIAKKGSISQKQGLSIAPAYSKPDRISQNTVHGTSSRTPIPAHVAHQVRLRDQGQCQFKIPTSSNSGQTSLICASRRWTDLHHVLPVSQGGAHTPDNLLTLCRAHHQQTHHR